MNWNVTLYLELIKMEFKKHLVYRASFITGIFNYSIQMGAYLFLWSAVYGQRSSLGGLGKNEMLSYVIIAWIARAFYFNNVDREISKEIEDGKVALELIRPYNYTAVKVARALGEAGFRLLFFSLPSAVVIYFLHPFELPDKVMIWAVFLLACLGAFMLNVQLSIITGFCAFFTHSTAGLIRAKRVVLDLFSGLLIPISFYPPWAQDLIKYLPFQSISYLPNLIYLEKISGWAAVQVLITQLVWILILALIAKLIWRRALAALVVQGG